jgi:hypothetical protein
LSLDESVTLQFWPYASHQIKTFAGGSSLAKIQT